jgi:hypothetical protein
MRRMNEEGISFFRDVWKLGRTRSEKAPKKLIAAYECEPEVTETLPSPRPLVEFQFQ